MTIRELIEKCSSLSDYIWIGANPWEDQNPLYVYDGLVWEEIPDELMQLQVESWGMYTRVNQIAQCEVMIEYYLYIQL